MVQNGKYKIYIRNTCNKYLYINKYAYIHIIIFRFNIKYTII